VEEVEQPVHESKRNKRSKKVEETETEVEEKQAEIELTAMQIAWQTAQDRAKSKNNAHRKKRVKSNSSEQEEILNRTLEKRLPTSV
jgi:hypothetical protein